MRRTRIGRALFVGVFTAGAATGLALTAATGAGASTPTSVTFSYTGAEQTFTVPAGVTSLSVVAIGAAGGTGIAGPGGGAGGLGGPGTKAISTLAVTPGQTLYVEVGGVGANGSLSPGTGGFNGGGSAPPGGGGGGGASDIRTLSNTAPGTLASRLVEAGGGGGGGGGLGSLAGGSGGDIFVGATAGGGGVTGGGLGGPGTFLVGGTAGTAGILPGLPTTPASPGTLGSGGASGGIDESGGGGGGGLYGGGGGGSGALGGGGGGGVGFSYGPAGSSLSPTGEAAAVVISYVPPAQVAPAITSTDTTTFTVGQAGSFTVTATGTPSPTFSITGAPSWLSIDASTGVLSGTPPAGSGGTDAFTVTAANGVTPDATQSFTVLVDEAPSFASADTTTFRVGDAGSFQVTATGYPAPTLTETGILPSGVTFSPSGLLSGTPVGGTAGTYGIVITASNTFAGADHSATQDFTLRVLAEVHPVPVVPPTAPTAPLMATATPATPPSAPATTTAGSGSLALTGIDLAGLIEGAAVLLGGGAVLWFMAERRRGLHARRH